MGLGIDCDSSCINHAQDILKDYTFVARYIAPTKNEPLTKEEAVHLSIYGLFVVTVYQSGPSIPSKYTYEQGVIDGQTAAEVAVSIGIPPGKPIYFVIDCDISASQAIQYLQGVENRIAEYRIGVYASGAILFAVRKNLGIYFLWLAGATGWPQYEEFKNSGYASLIQIEENVQMFGLNVDINQSNNNAGGWQIIT
jgi:hypothetical protein